MKRTKERFFKIPLVFRFLIRMVTSESDWPWLKGDYEEIYEDKCKNCGRTFANIWMIKQVATSSVIFYTESIVWSIIMLKNYLKTAIRSFVQHKGYSLIKISGLAIGFACCILLMLWVRDELNFDRFHEEAERIYSVRSGLVDQPGPLGPYLKNNYAEIENAVRLFYISPAANYKDRTFKTEGYYADESYFSVFTHHFIKGSPKDALLEPYSIVLTEETAGKLFGNENPVGKMITADGTINAKVTGVIKNIPKNSHLQFDFLISDKSFFNAWSERWGSHTFYTYLLLKKNTDYKDLQSKIVNVVNDRMNKPSAGLKLVCLTDIHLYFDGAIKYVYIFSVIAVFILLIACINFMNLSTARMSNRNIEIAIRKVVGAGKANLVRQLLSESVIMTFFSAFLAILLVWATLPYFNSAFNKELSLNFSENSELFLYLFAITVFTGLVSGSYPALLMSSFRTVKLLKKSGAGTGKNTGLRKTLVVIQFSISTFLIIGTLVVNNQLKYIRNMDPGYDRQHLMYLITNPEIRQNADSFKLDLLRNTNIKSAALSTSLPVRVGQITTGIEWDGKDPETNPRWYYVFSDFDYVKTMGLELAEGRDFSRKFPTDATDAYIINEKAVKDMGFSSAAGKRFNQWGNEGTIVGVVKDFHFRTLHQEIRPLLIRIRPDGHLNFQRYVILKFGNNRLELENTIKYVQEVWNKYASGFPFETHFVDDRLNYLYRSEQVMGRVIKYFSFLAIFISCLGLLGLAMHLVDLRTKEVGIRKVLGASSSGIVYLLSKDLLIWVIAANIVSWPAAYIIMNKWLENFIYKTELSLLIFIFAGFSALAIALSSVSYLAFKAAAANPVNSLRSE